MVGPLWRVSSDNPSCRTYYKEPASNGNYSTITTAREQCQTTNLAQVTGMLQNSAASIQRDILARLVPSATLPCYGLSVDAVALRIRLGNP